MSELASALFSIADASEFRFARFYIVCEEAQLALLESPLIVSGCVGHAPDGLSKRGKTRNSMPPVLRDCPFLIFHHRDDILPYVRCQHP